MNRREFTIASAVISLGATHGALATAVSSMHTCVLQAPAACVGATYALDNGIRLTVLSVDALHTDDQWQQWRVSFESSKPLAEGVYGLRSQQASVSDVQLFLQSNGSRVSASISRAA